MRSRCASHSLCTVRTYVRTFCISAKIKITKDETAKDLGRGFITKNFTLNFFTIFGNHAHFTVSVETPPRHVLEVRQNFEQQHTEWEFFRGVRQGSEVRTVSGPFFFLLTLWIFPNIFSQVFCCAMEEHMVVDDAQDDGDIVLLVHYGEKVR